MIYKQGKMTIKPYWEAKFDSTDKDLKYYTDLIQTWLVVGCHKISDVKVGSFLSGGIDSSYITALLMPHKSFSVGFGYDEFDETSHAVDLSNMLGIKNYKKIISSEEC